MPVHHKVKRRQSHKPLEETRETLHMHGFVSVQYMIFVIKTKKSRRVISFICYKTKKKDGKPLKMAYNNAVM